MDELLYLRTVVRDLQILCLFLGGLLVLVGVVLAYLPVRDEWPKHQKRKGADDLRERLFGRQVTSSSDGDDGEPAGPGGDAGGAPGLAGASAGDVPSVVVPDDPADQAASPVGLGAEGDEGDAFTP